jgi:hypothetical protein
MTAVNYSGEIKLLNALSPHLKKANFVANILELETFINKTQNFTHYLLVVLFDEPTTTYTEVLYWRLRLWIVRENGEEKGGWKTKE